MSERPANHEISFKPRVVLRLNDAIIEAPDISPEFLYDFITLHTSLLADRIDNLYQAERASARRPENVIRPTILIARLALLGYERKTFDGHGLDLTNSPGLPPSNLTDKFVPYWESAARTTFTPQVSVRGAKATEGTGGVWLGVTN